MQINKKLNFVIPLYRDDSNPYAYVHSAPVSREVFDANFWLLGKAYSAIHDEGLGGTAGPRVAALVLKHVAKGLAGDDGDPDALASSFINELRRLSNVLSPGPGGWEVTPFQVAVDRKTLDEEDVAEVESAIVFFTLGWLMYPRQNRQSLLEAGTRMVGGRTTSLTCTEYSASLSTSTATASSGATAGVS